MNTGYSESPCILCRTFFNFEIRKKTRPRKKVRGRGSLCCFPLRRIAEKRGGQALSYFLPIQPAMTIRWTSLVPS